MKISFTNWVLISLSLFYIVPFITVLSKRLFGRYFNPLSVYTAIWIAVGICYSLVSRIFPAYSGRGILVQILGHSGYILGCFSIVIMPNYTFYKGNHSSQYAWYLPESTLYKILWIALVFRILSIALSVYNVLKIAGSLNSYLLYSSSVRAKYLSRSDIPSFSNSLFTNLLTLPVGLGLVVAAMYLSVKKDETILPYIYLALSPLQSLILMSKWQGIVEPVFFLWVLFLCLRPFDFSSNRHVGKKIKMMFHRENMRKKGIGLKVLLIAGILGICLLALVAKQRDYSNQGSPIPGLSAPIAKTFMYIVTGSVALSNLVERNRGGEFAGILTFRPFVKWLVSFGFLNKSYLPDLFEEPIRNSRNIEFGNIYTWLGIFYRDFGLVGVFFMPFILGFLTSFAFLKAGHHFSLLNLSLSAILGTAILLSFLNFMFHQTYYLLLPIFCGFIDYLLRSRDHR